MERLEFDSRDSMAKQMSQAIAERLNRAIEKTGEAGLAVSGGRTPTGLFNALSDIDLQWRKVTVTLVDDRWVDPEHDDSNEKLVRAHLLQNKAVEAHFIPMKTKEASPFEAEVEVNKALSNLPEELTVTVLGMGGDGHTASFFPGSETLDRALDTKHHYDCCAVEPKTAPYLRMTLTLRRILRSQWIVLQVTGEGKKAVLEQALEDGPVEELPVRSVLKQTLTPVSVYWVK